MTCVIRRRPLSGCVAVKWWSAAGCRFTGLRYIWEQRWDILRLSFCNMMFHKNEPVDTKRHEKTSDLTGSSGWNPSTGVIEEQQHFNFCLAVSWVDTYFLLPCQLLFSSKMHHGCRYFFFIFLPWILTLMHSPWMCIRDHFRDSASFSWHRVYLNLFHERKL